MALVRCKSCGIDTSDSLDRCPNCGGSPSGLRLASALGAAAKAAGRAASGSDKAEAAGQALREVVQSLRSVPRVVWVVAGLIALATVPLAFPVLFVLMILWLLGRRRPASQQRRVENEVLQILKRPQSSARRAAANRPLERLRLVEQRTTKRDA